MSQHILIIWEKAHHTIVTVTFLSVQSFKIFGNSFHNSCLNRCLPTFVQPNNSLEITTFYIFLDVSDQHFAFILQLTRVFLQINCNFDLSLSIYSSVFWVHTKPVYFIISNSLSDFTLQPGYIKIFRIPTKQHAKKVKVVHKYFRETIFQDLLVPRSIEENNFLYWQKY